MQATQSAPQLPGISGTTPYLVNAITFGGVVFLCAGLVSLMTVLMTVVPTQSNGHLPWPLAQRALTTPDGVLATSVAIVLIIGPSLVAGQRRILRRRFLARAVDVTTVPPWVWLTRPPVRPAETRADRWLGRSRRVRIASVALLVVATLIALLVVADLVASFVAGVTLSQSAECGERGCPPMYPLIPILLGSEFAMFGLSSLAQYHLLRRVEASSGIWLRLRSWFATPAFFYIRRPGVTPEATVAALTRLTTTEPMPIAQVYAISVLAALPFFLMFIVGSFLDVWLRTQWIPG